MAEVYVESAPRRRPRPASPPRRSGLAPGAGESGAPGNVYQFVTGPDGYVAGGSDRQPTAGAYARIDDLEPRWHAVHDRMQALVSGPVADFNAALAERGAGAIMTARR